MKALASLSAVLVLAFAGSASAREARIAFGDLDLSSPAGADAFDARVESAAYRMCRGARRSGSLITDRAACRAAVRDEAVRQLPGRVQVDYALSRVPIVA